MLTCSRLVPAWSAALGMVAASLIAACGEDAAGLPAAPPAQPTQSTATLPSAQAEMPADDPADIAPRPSAGCGKAVPDGEWLGQQYLDPGASYGRFLITRPPAYDPSTPYPIFFLFHGANQTEQDCRGTGNCAGVQMALERDAIVVYQKSVGAAWTTTADDVSQNIEVFDSILSAVSENLCVDQNRVTAMGTSSGAHFTNILACERGSVLRAVVPAAGEAMRTEGCAGEIAALVIHGVSDTSVPFERGEEAREWYRTRNGCSEATEPALADMHAEVTTARAAGEEIFRCVDYQGCREGTPLRWCEHSVGGYDGSTHGFPPSGGPEALRFTFALVGAAPPASP